MHIGIWLMPTRRMASRVVVVAMEGIRGGLMGWGLGRWFIGLSRLLLSFMSVLIVQVQPFMVE